MPTESTSVGAGATRFPTAEPSLHRRSPLGAVATGAAVVTAVALLLAACGGGGTFVSSTSTTPSTNPPTTSLPATSVLATVAGTALPSSAGGAGAADTSDSRAETDDATDDDGADGDAVAATAAAPCETYTPNDALPLQRCDSGPLVLAVQLALQSSGYDITALDSKFGDQTDAAVRAFQEAESLEVDGLVGPQTWSAIDFPSNVATDANGDGAISPDEVTVG